MSDTSDPPRPKRSAPSYGRQLLFSLLAAVIITVLTIAVVTAKIGPGLDSEELYDTRSERQDLIDERQDRQEEQQEADGDNSGPG